MQLIIWVSEAAVENAFGCDQGCEAFAVVAVEFGEGGIVAVVKIDALAFAIGTYQAEGDFVRRTGIVFFAVFIAVKPVFVI